MSTSTGYPVAWKGKQLALGRLTTEVKEAFVLWHEPRALKRAKRILEPVEYLNFRQEVVGGAIYWNTMACMSIAVEFTNPEGKIQLARLLFGQSIIETDPHGKVTTLSDAELGELIAEKEADPSSDYALAMEMIWETENPKAKTGSVPLPVPADSTDCSST